MILRRSVPPKLKMVWFTTGSRLKLVPLVLYMPFLKDNSSVEKAVILQIAANAPFLAGLASKENRVTYYYKMDHKAGYTGPLHLFTREPHQIDLIPSMDRSDVKSRKSLNFMGWGRDIKDLSLHLKGLSFSPETLQLSKLLLGPNDLVSTTKNIRLKGLCIRNCLNADTALEAVTNGFGALTTFMFISTMCVS